MTVAYIPPVHNEEQSQISLVNHDHRRNALANSQVSSASRGSTSPEGSDDEANQRLSRADSSVPSPTSAISVLGPSQTSSTSSAHQTNVELVSDSIGVNPSLQFYRMTWWEMLMSAYSPNTEDA